MRRWALRAYTVGMLALVAVLVAALAWAACGGP
jgi:hypothetical protein